MAPYQASNKPGRHSVFTQITVERKDDDDDALICRQQSTFISITDSRLLNLRFPVDHSRLPIQCCHTQMHIRRDIRRCVDTARQDKSPPYRPGPARPGPAGMVMSDGKAPVANWVVGRMGRVRPPHRRRRKARKSIETHPASSSTSSSSSSSGGGGSSRKSLAMQTS